MKAFNRLSSRTLVLAQDNIDTDQIIPARFLTTTTRDGLGQHCFADWRFDDQGQALDHVLNTADASSCQILVAGKNFGCGSSREHAPWALLDFGFRVVISSEIADIFRGNSQNNGLLPIVIDEADHRWLLENPGTEVSVDLPQQFIEFAAGQRAGFAGGHRAHFEIDAFAKHCLVNGIDPLGFLLDQQDTIATFEQGARRVSERRIVLLPGDGIGPEIVAPTRRLLEVVAARGGYEFSFSEHLIGGAAIDANGEPLSEQATADCQHADAVLLGAVGGPKWSDPNAPVRPEQGLLALRKALGVFANLRPVKPEPSLFAQSPLKADRLEGVDLLVVRELTGGTYFGDKTEGEDRASDACVYTREEIDRVVRMAGELARARRGKLTLVDKANVMATSRLWRRVTTAIVESDFADLEFDIELVDAAAMHLLSNPARFDVIVTENLFGDILTDEASMLAGSLGMLPSASLGAAGPGLYEPIHGSAPDIAGQDKANPFATFLSAAMLLENSLGLAEPASWIRDAVSVCLDAGQCTADIGGTLGTEAAADAVIEHLNNATAEAA